MTELREIRRETYGNDARAINRHSERVYTDGRKRLYTLSKTLDGLPPFYEAYGPYTADCEGLLPRLRVDGEEYWGDGWSWRRAEQAFCRAIGARIVS